MRRSQTSAESWLYVQSVEWWLQLAWADRMHCLFQLVATGCEAKQGDHFHGTVTLHETRDTGIVINLLQVNDLSQLLSKVIHLDTLSGTANVLKFSQVLLGVKVTYHIISETSATISSFNWGKKKNIDSKTELSHILFDPHTHKMKLTYFGKVVVLHSCCC